jgi:two-component system nitrogen regulation sensor histidine kinase NtrY
MEKKFGSCIDDPVFKQCTSLIIKEVSRIQSMVSDFSGFAIMPGIDLKKDSLIPLLQELLDVFKISHADIEWKLEMNGDIPDILLDKKSMHRAIYNIFSNAAEAIHAKNASEEKDFVLTKVYCTHSLSETFVVLDIVDNGKGLDEEELARLFEPYFSKKPTGTGLGLAIVQSIITDHHGTIAAKQENMNTVIEIRLPIAQ